MSSPTPDGSSPTTARRDQLFATRMADRLRMADNLTLQDRVEASQLAGEPPWNAARLQVELQDALLKAPIRPPLTADDLIRSWDKGSKGAEAGDGELTSREYMIALKRLVGGDEELWYGMVRSGAIEAFYKIDHSSDGSLSRAELCRWIDPAIPSSHAHRPSSPSTQAKLHLGTQRLQQEREKEARRRRNLWMHRPPPPPVVFLNNGMPAFGGHIVRKWRGEPMHAWQGTVVQPGASGPKRPPPSPPPSSEGTTNTMSSSSALYSSSSPSHFHSRSAPTSPSSPFSAVSPRSPSPARSLGRRSQLNQLSSASTTLVFGSPPGHHGASSHDASSSSVSATTSWVLTPSAASQSQQQGKARGGGGGGGGGAASPRAKMAAASALSDTSMGRAFPTAAQLNIEIDLGDRMYLRKAHAEPKAHKKDMRRPVSAPSPRQATRSLRILAGPDQGTANLFHRWTTPARAG